MTSNPIHSLPSSWQQDLREAYRDPAELLSALNLSHRISARTLIQAHSRFSFLVPRSYAARIRPNDPDDPLLRQVLPDTRELTSPPDYSADPLQEQAVLKTRGLLHKYHGRVLLIVTGHCAIQCRYCFRREFPYNDAQLTHSQLTDALSYIHRDNSISEVILSGGDPLLLSDQRLDQLIEQLANIPHVRRLRIHSRIPVVLPSRVQAGLIECLTRSRLQTVLVLHSNHPNEINQEVHTALQMFRERRISLLNQAVLLKGINDDTTNLVELSETLFSAGVLPYYLHLLDKTTGTGHFDVAEAKARDLLITLQTTLPGYLVPRLVRETAGAAYKLPVY